jgi:hypothetical protein
MDEDEALPPAAAEPLAELWFGHEQEAAGVLTEPLICVSPILPCTWVWSGQVQLAEGSEDEEAEPPAAALPPVDEPDTDGAELEPLAAEGDEVLLALEVVLPVCEDWLDCAPWFMDEVEPTSVEDWFAETLEFVVLLPLPMFTPGLMFAPAFTSVLLMPTFASTPTFGLMFTPVLVELDGALEPEAALGELEVDVEPVLDDWSVDVPWLMVDVEFVSLEVWFADTLEFVVLLPLEPFVPTFTPGLTFAPALTSLLPMPTLAPTPTFGLTFTLLSVLVCANADPNAPITAAAVILTARRLILISSLSFSGWETPCHAASAVPRQERTRR